MLQSGHKRTRYSFFSQITLWIVALFFVDIVSKHIFQSGQYNNYYITNVLNTSGAWGFNIPIFFLILIALNAIILFFYFYNNKYINTWTLIFLTGGTLGNVYDRVFYFGVRDRINIHMLPIFNLADVFLTIGVLILLFTSFVSSAGKK